MGLGVAMNMTGAKVNRVCIMSLFNLSNLESTSCLHIVEFKLVVYFSSMCWIGFRVPGLTHRFWLRIVPLPNFATLNLTTDIWNGALGGCDWSAEDAYSSAAPDPTFAFAGGPCCPTLDFVIAFWITIALKLHIVNFAILYWHTGIIQLNFV
jgi:hypothetical protein